MIGNNRTSEAHLNTMVPVRMSAHGIQISQNGRFDTSPAREMMRPQRRRVDDTDDTTDERRETRGDTCEQPGQGAAPIGETAGDGVYDGSISPSHSCREGLAGGVAEAPTNSWARARHRAGQSGGPGRVSVAEPRPTATCPALIGRPPLRAGWSPIPMTGCRWAGRRLGPAAGLSPVKHPLGSGRQPQRSGWA
jgi:hypothetical protein